ncbi:transposase [Alteribacillus sp. YIM 98480]|uniref:transposase n=1 Tax=Alteribacillus sp. YIM 98480 TaxID=2606599 RepID=UPI00351AF64C
MALLNSSDKLNIRAAFHLTLHTVCILNSFAFGYTNGFIESLNNQTKVIKRNAFGFNRYGPVTSSMYGIFK